MLFVALSEINKTCLFFVEILLIKIIIIRNDIN